MKNGCTYLQYLRVLAIEATSFETALHLLAGLDVLRARQQILSDPDSIPMRVNLLDCLVDDVPHDGHRVLLPKSHYSTDSLSLDRRVPLGLQDVDSIGDCQIIQSKHS
jgi:hypothetical protein